MKTPAILALIAGLAASAQADWTGFYAVPSPGTAMITPGAYNNWTLSRSGAGGASFTVVTPAGPGVIAGQTLGTGGPLTTMDFTAPAQNNGLFSFFYFAPATIPGLSEVGVYLNGVRTPLTGAGLYSTPITYPATFGWYVKWDGISGGSAPSMTISNFDHPQVPEPGTIAMGAVALVGAAGVAYRKKIAAKKS